MGLEEKLPSGVLTTTVATMLNIARKNSLWPAQFGLACCAIEMMAVGGPRYDIARFGMERFSATPRQADLMIVAGRVSQKMAPVLRQIYDQMPEPKWVIAMGVCASSGGMFNNYAIVQGVDHIVPVDMYLPGCPPRPEMLTDAILKLHHKIQHEPLGPRRAAQQAAARADGTAPDLHIEMPSSVRADSDARRAYEAAAARRVRVDRGATTWSVARGHLLTLVQALRDDAALRFELCSSVPGVDYEDSGGPAATPDRPRLHVVYHLTSMTYRRRIRLEVAVTADDPHVPSVTGIYPTADWHERETFDMFGIVF